MLNSVDFSRIFYKGQLVLTSDQLAKAYGVNPVNLQRNFMRNKHAYQEGVHYFHLDGKELAEFKKEGNPGYFPTVRSLYLWTKEGARMQALSLINRIDSFSVYDKLVESYYGETTMDESKKESSKQVDPYVQLDMYALLQSLIETQRDILEQNTQMLNALKEMLKKLPLQE